MFDILRQCLKAGCLCEPITRGAGPAEYEFCGADLPAKLARLGGGRSLHIRQVDAGSCNACELEAAALGNPFYDAERFGIHFVASPRHADVLLVTGPVTRQMEAALRKTYEATPEPRIVVACGDCARDCGVFAGSYAVAGPVESVIPVDIKVKGCPPSPLTLLRALLDAAGRL